MLNVWAYNSCGNSAPAKLTQKTSACNCSVPCGGSGNITTIAGNGTAGFSGDGGQATCAELNNLYGVALDAAGNIYIADQSNNRIRKVDASTGIISTIAGNGTAGFSGDGGPATAAELNAPVDIAFDAAGNLYISDQVNFRVRKINTSGIITTFAGSGMTGYSGNGGPATSAQMSYPYGIAIDAQGNVYFADAVNSVIWKVNTSGIISTFAGTGTRGFAGDGGPANNAELDYPYGIAFDPSGNLYIADADNVRIRKINTSNTISTFAGDGTNNFNGDGGQATSAEFNFPNSVASDVSGNIYIADSGNSRIRKVNVSSGIINTFAGSDKSGFSGDGGPATNAELFIPSGVTIDNSGNVFIVDEANNRIREVCH